MSNDGSRQDGPAKQRPSRSSFKFNCCGFQEQERSLIQKAKAKGGRKAINHALRVQAVMRALERGVTADLISGMAVFKRRIDRDKLADLLEQGKFDEAVEFIPWDDMEGDLSKIQPKMESAANGASEQAIKQLPAPKATLVVGTANPNIRRFINNQVGNLVTDISQESRRAVQGAITQSFDQGLTPRRTANIVQQSVGLTEKQTNRVMNKQLKEFEKRDKLQERLTSLQQRGLGGSKSASNVRRSLALLTDDKIERRTEKFAASQQRNRALTIARTELTRATNEGQIATWEQAAADGLIDRNQARKVWVVVPDDRLSNICADLDGQSRQMDETFLVNQTGEAVTGPPAHPNCRSALSLKFEDE